MLNLIFIIVCILKNFKIYILLYHRNPTLLDPSGSTLDLLQTDLPLRLGVVDQAFPFLGPAPPSLLRQFLMRIGPRFASRISAGYVVFSYIIGLRLGTPQQLALFVIVFSLLELAMNDVLFQAYFLYTVHILVIYVLIFHLYI